MQAVQEIYGTCLGKFMLQMVDRQLEAVVYWTFHSRLKNLLGTFRQW